MILLRLVLLSFYLRSLAAVAVVLGPHFNQAVEFPNYFLPRNFSSLTATDQTRVLKESRTLLEEAVGSITDRMVVPIAPEGSQGIQMVRYFDHIGGAVTKIDPTAKVMPSGGVVRSILGYLYEEIQNGIEKNPGLDPAEILRNIARSTRDIPAIEVRGVGGDFDLLIKAQKDKFDQIQEYVVNVTNSAEDALGARHSRHTMKRMLFTVGDVKDYDSQIARSTGQGGSTIDFLAYDRKLRSFVEPPTHPFVVDDFLQGFYRYLPPQSVQAAEDTEKQLVRGIRPLLEMPFIRLKDEAQFLAELDSLIRSGGIKSAKAIEQIGKSVRNGRRSLGNNRIVRGAPNSVESKVRTLSELLAKTGQPHIPEYGERSPIVLRNAITKTELNGFPRELLIGYDRFAQEFSENGVLTHGTPTIDGAMSIMRGGFYYSGGAYRQGGSVEGGGVYAAGKRAGAKAGIQLSLPVKSDSRVNIIQWDQFQAHPAFQRINAEANRIGLDIHQYLQRYHGIDIIIKNAVLVQNIDVLEIGTPLERVTTLVNGMRHGFEDPTLSATQRLASLNNFLELADYSEGLGLHVEPVPRAAVKSLSSQIIKDLISMDQKDTEAIIETMHGVKESLARLQSRGFDVDIVDKNFERQIYTKFIEEEPLEKIRIHIDLFEDETHYKSLVRRLQKEITQSPRTREVVWKDRERVIEQVHKRQPRLRAVIGNGYLEPDKILDQKLRLDYIRLTEENKVRGEIEATMSSLFNRDADRLRKSFPHYAFPKNEAPRWEADGVGFKGKNYTGRVSADLYNRLLAKPAMGISESEEKLIRTMLEDTGSREQLHEFFKLPKAAAIIKEELLLEKNGHRVRGILRNPGPPEPIKEFILSKLKSDHAFRGRIRNLFVKNMTQHEPLSYFPWDISVAGDRAQLRSYLLHSQGLDDQLRQHKSKILERYGLKVNESGYGYSVGRNGKSIQLDTEKWNSLVPADDRARLKQLEARIVLRDAAIGQVRHLSADAKEEFVRDFRGLNSLLDKLIESERKDHLTKLASQSHKDLLSRLAAAPRQAPLPVDIRDEISAILKKPLQSGAAYADFELFAARSHPAVADILFERLDKPIPGDDRGLVARIARRVDTDRFHRIFRRHSPDLEDFIHTRFDLSHDEDAAALKKMLANVTRSSAEIRAESDKVAAEIIRLQPREFPTKDKISNRTKMIANTELRAKWNSLYQERYWRDTIDSTLTRFFNQDPDRALALFPEYKFRELESPQWDFHSQSNRWVGRNYLGNRYAELLDPEKIAHLEVGQKIEEKDLALLKRAARSGSKEQLEALIKVPKYREALAKIYKEKEMVPYARALTTGYGKDELRAFMEEEMARDDGFRSHVRRVSVKAGVEESGRFSWTLDDPKDRKYILSALRSKSAHDVELRKLNGELAEKHGLVFFGDQYHRIMGPHRLEPVLDRELDQYLTDPLLRARHKALSEKSDRIRAATSAVLRKAESDGASAVKEFFGLDANFDKEIAEKVSSYEYKNIEEPFLEAHKDLRKALRGARGGALPAVTREEISKLLKQPLKTKEQAVLWKSLLEQAEASDLLASRLENLGPADDKMLAIEMVRPERYRSPHPPRIVRLFTRLSLGTDEIWRASFEPVEGDIKIVKSLLADYPRSKTVIRQDINAAKAKAALQEPKLSAYYGANFSTKEYQDRELARHVEALEEEFERRSHLETQLKNMFDQESDLMRKSVPEFNFGKLEAPRLDKVADKFEGKNFLGRKYATLLNQVQDGHFVGTLTDEQMGLVRDLVRERYINEQDLRNLGLLQVEEFTQLIAEELKKDNAASTEVVRELLRSYDKREARKVVVDLLDADPVFRKRILQAYLKNMDTNNLQQFPWNADNPRERRLLEAAMKVHDAEIERFRVKSLHRLEKYAIFNEYDRFYRIDAQGRRIEILEAEYLSLIPDASERRQVKAELAKAKGLLSYKHIAQRVLGMHEVNDACRLYEMLKVRGPAAATP